MNDFDAKATPDTTEQNVFGENVTPELTQDMKWCDVPNDTTLHEIMRLMGAPENPKFIVKELKLTCPGVLNTEKGEIDAFFTDVANTQIQRFERSHDEPAANKLRHALQSLPQMTLGELNNLTLDEWLDTLFTRKHATFILEKNACELIGDITSLLVETLAGGNAEAHEKLIEPFEKVFSDKFEKPLLASIGAKLCEAEQADAAAKAAKREQRKQTVRDGAKSFGTGVAALVGHVGKSRVGAAVIAAFGEAATVGKSFLDGLTSRSPVEEEPADEPANDT